jgi:hypothetical protein
MGTSKDNLIFKIFDLQKQLTEANEIIDILRSNFPKVYNQILEYQENL